MFGGVDEVGLFERIFCEVEELFEVLFWPEEVFVVFADEGFGGRDKGGVTKGGMLVEKFGAPGWFFVSKVEGGEVLALHAFRSDLFGCGEDGGSEVYVESKVFIFGAVF